MIDDDMTEVRRRSGLAAMASIDAIDDEFICFIGEAGEPIRTAYAHLIAKDLTHSAAIGMIHGIVGSIMEQARDEA